MKFKHHWLVIYMRPIKKVILITKLTSLKCRNYAADVLLSFCRILLDLRKNKLKGVINMTSVQEIYSAIFKEYPDVLDVKQVSELLGVSTKTVYRLLRDEKIQSLKIGREFRIPKIYVMKYVKLFGACHAG